MRIDDQGVWLPATLGDRLSVEINGRRVWSFSAARDGRPEPDGDNLVPWPEVLVPYLNGRADVLLRSLDSDTVLFDGSLALGEGTGSIDLVDEQGRPLVVSKTQKLSAATFDDATAGDREKLVDAIVQALDLLTERGHDAFLVYGNLLGAVRSGTLIGHDDDADIAYLARASHPVDVMLEGFDIERQFIEAGWRTIRYSGGTFKLLVTFPGGLEVAIDVFTAFYFDGLLHMMPFVAADVPRDALVPTSTVVLEGREVTAPAKPEVLLEATFGPGWRIPDPTFRHKEPRWLRRRLSGLLRGDRRHQSYWETFYKTKADKVPTDPSSFARWVAERQPRPASLIDVGSGTGRDSIWLAAQGITVLGCDYSAAGVEYARERALERGVSATYRRLNLYDLRQMLVAGALLDREQHADAVYARFLVHALEDEGRQNLWRFSRTVLASTRGRLFLEFRTEPTDHVFGEHYRSFVSPETVSAEIEKYGFGIEHCEVSHGLAVHGDEDPLVCRLTAKLRG